MSRSAEYRAKLRRVLEDLKIDAFLVPHEDRFLSEYTAPGSARLGFITGFTGSAGLALIKIVVFLPCHYEIVLHAMEFSI